MAIHLMPRKFSGLVLQYIDRLESALESHLLSALASIKSFTLDAYLYWIK